MKDIYDEIFDAVPTEIDPEILPTEVVESKPPAIIKPALDSKDRDEDISYVRQNLKELIDKGTDALDELLDISNQTRHPRSYEVLANLLSQLVSTNKELVELHKSQKKLSDSEGETEKKSVTNQTIVFSGTTAEMDKLIKKLTKT